MHGIEEAVAQKYTRNSRRGFYLPIIVRYADDLVAVHDDLNIIREVQELIETQLKPMVWSGDMGNKSVERHG
jgi:hypothetical protein